MTAFRFGFIVVLFDFDNTIGYFTQYRELLHKINEKHNLNPATKYNNNKTILRKLIELNVLLRPNIINVLKYLTNNKNKLNILEINIFTKIANHHVGLFLNLKIKLKKI